MQTKNKIWLCPLMVLGLVLILTNSCKKKEESVDKITDKDGNVYTSVTIGTQVWMVENLKTTHYTDDTTIPNVTDSSTWAGLTTASYCWYNNDAVTNKATYGALYNWYTVNTGKLCPTGWHVPTDVEWTTLTDYLKNNGYGYGGSGSAIAKSMAAISGWITDKTPGDVGNDPTSNNSSGFTALPGGFRYYALGFTELGYCAIWWSSTEINTIEASYRLISNDASVINTKHALDLKTSGFSVRCLRDQ